MVIDKNIQDYGKLIINIILKWEFLHGISQPISKNYAMLLLAFNR